MILRNLVCGAISATLFVVVPAFADVAPKREVIVMAMHGGIPNDFPHEEMPSHHGHGHEQDKSDSELDSLQAYGNAQYEKLKNWPRTAENDPYFTGSQNLGEALARATGLNVVTCFNEFCAPDVPAAIDSAVALGATRVIVITPMMTPGGGHSERDIPSSIQAAQGSHPQVEMVYAWPFQVDAIAGFLAEHMKSFAASGVSARR